MAPLKILICGGGCAGPALAHCLAGQGHKIVIVERFPALRASGAQIDLREQGIEVVKRMGLLDAVRANLVDEPGVSFVDSNGKTFATIMANTSGKGAQSLTSEYEIMRGDVVRLLYDATKDDVEYVFNKTVESFEQDEKQVLAYFSDGTSDTFDILVGADGQGSRIRKAILPPDAPDPYRRLGVHNGYWFIPRIDTDDNIRRSYNCPGGRMIFRRSHNPTTTQVYFILKDDNPEISSIHRASVEQQKEFWAQRFRDAGWETERFLEGMKTTENFYSQECLQVRTDTWYKNRVVLLGDAAHCPSPFSGMGTSGSFVGAYVLAGEITRNPDNLPLAFANYDKTLRPFVKEIQNVPLSLMKLAAPETQWGIAVLHWIVWLICLLGIPDLISRFSSDKKGGWSLPEYTELKFNRQ
ncbi:hypothetical protein FDECE_12773 [Fusarium decemcellulare]|nr:hypothetical protein FDECE_12773 [Fusarium decemcellulare]